MIVTEDSRKKLPNLVRWFSYVRSTKPFFEVIGASELCGKEAFSVAEADKKDA